MSVKTIGWVLLFLAFGQLSQADSTSVKKSEDKAVVRSLLGTLIPGALSIGLITGGDETVGVGLLSVGLLFGPGLGHLYAENNRAFSNGLLVRALGGGIMVFGTSKLELFSDDNNGAEYLMLLGGVVILSSMVNDITKADNSVRSYNQNHKITQVILYPSFNAQRGDVRMNLSYRF